MPDLAAEAVRAAAELAVDHEPAADACAERCEQEARGAPAVTEHELAERRGGGVVLDDDGRVDASRELARDVHALESGDVGQPKAEAVGVDLARDREADGFGRSELEHGTGYRVQHHARAAIGGRFAGHELLHSTAVDARRSDVRAAEIDADHQAVRKSGSDAGARSSSTVTRRRSTRSSSFDLRRAPQTSSSASPSASTRITRSCSSWAQHSPPTS
jgi:hypothetical protein